MILSAIRIFSVSPILVLFVSSGPVMAQISSIVKAPIVSDGNVASAVPDFVINLDISPDPTVDGRLFSIGEAVRITFPPDFVRNPNEAEQVEPANVFSSESCAPGNIQCTTGIMVQGWPQRPIVPMVPPMPLGEGDPVYQVSMSDNVMVLDVVQEITKAGPLSGPGVKGFHVILRDYMNPPSKEEPYTIGLEFLDSAGNVTEEHEGQVQIIDSVRPSINVTSILTDSGLQNPNTIYQETTPGEEVPLPYDFYMWQQDPADPLSGIPLTGVSIVSENDSLLLKTGDETVGSVTLVTPAGGEDAIIFSPETFDEPIPAFLSGEEAGRFRAVFQAGSVPGDYEAVFSMNGGNTATMFTSVVPEPSSVTLLLIASTIGLTIRRYRI